MKNRAELYEGEEVSLEKAFIGDLVMRGPNWEYGTQDCDWEGNPSIGVIIDIDFLQSEHSEHSITVFWKKNGDKYIYRPSDLVFTTDKEKKVKILEVVNKFNVTKDFF